MATGDVKKLVAFFTSRGQLKEALLVAQVLLHIPVYVIAFSYSFLTLKMTSIFKTSSVQFIKLLNNETLLFTFVFYWPLFTKRSEKMYLILVLNLILLNCKGAAIIKTDD